MPASESKDHTDQIEYRLARKAPMLDILVTAGAFAFIMVIMVLRGVRLDPLFLLVVAVFMIGASLHYLRRKIRATADRSVKLRIGPQGIEFPGKVAGPIPWHAVERIFTYMENTERKLHVVLADPARFGLAPQNRWRKAVDGEGLTLNLALLEEQRPGIHATLRRFAPPEIMKGYWP